MDSMGLSRKMLNINFCNTCTPRPQLRSSTIIVCHTLFNVIKELGSMYNIRKQKNSNSVIFVMSVAIIGLLKIFLSCLDYYPAFSLFCFN